MNTLVMDEPISKRMISWDPRLLLCVSVLSVLLLVIITALTAVLVHRTFDSPSKSEVTKLSLREMYPGYFRTQLEQKSFEGLNRNVAIGAKVVNVTIVGNGTARFIPMYPADVVDRNACCYSTGKHVSPRRMEDITGITRTMAIFQSDTGDEAKQYFYTEKCKQVNGCDFCSCSQRPYYFTGIYLMEADADEELEHNPRYELAWFSLPGCCKCRNIASM